MSHSTHDRLVYMANQIGKFFQSQGGEQAVSGVAEHIKKFWDPRMLKSIFAHHDAGGAGLDPAVKEAIGRLKQAAVAKEKAQRAAPRQPDRSRSAIPPTVT